MVRFTEFLLVLLQCHFHCGISSYWHKNRFQENFSSFVNWYKMWCSPDFEITLISRLLWTSSTTSIYSVFNLIELRIVLWLFSIYKSWSQALLKAFEEKLQNVEFTLCIMHYDLWFMLFACIMHLFGNCWISNFWKLLNQQFLEIAESAMHWNAESA